MVYKPTNITGGHQPDTLDRFSLVTTVFWGGEQEAGGASDLAPQGLGWLVIGEENSPWPCGYD